MACCVVLAAVAGGIVSLLAWLTGRPRREAAAWRPPQAGEPRGRP